jgi:DUF4097 and DUF4098 domain-containing protein YvlB
MANGPIRRRSIFGGLVLILIGTLFLLHNFAPDLGIARVISTYWPALLIFWGLAKLVDHFAAQRTGQASAPMISGSEVGLLFLLFVAIGSIVVVDWVHKRNPDFDLHIGIFDHSVSSTEELAAKPAAAGSTISITTPRGSINVRPEETDQVRVIVNRTVTSTNDIEAQRMLQKVHLTINSVPGGYDIRPQPGWEDAGSVKLDLEVHVPKQANVIAKTDRGDVNVSDISGPVAVTSGHGDVEIHNIGGDVSADMQRGDARISGIKGNVRLAGRGNEVDLGDITGDANIDGEFYGPIRTRNVGKTTHFLSSRTDLTLAQLTGHLEMNSGRLEISDLAGGLNLVTKNKDISLENVAGRIHIEDRHGDIEARFRQPPHEELSISNDSGPIDLTLPPGSNFEILATSRSGDIQTDFPGLKPAQEGDSSRLEGKVGARGPQIHLSTSYGTIHIRKGP